jgi:hypothetical protein
MLESIAVGAVGGVIGAVLARRGVRRRALRLAGQGQVELAVRVVDGAVPLLRPRWQLGHAMLDPGRLDFQGYVAGLRFLRRELVHIEVTAADPATRRAPTRSEARRFSRDCDIVALRTPAPTVEIMVPHPVDWRWVLSRLAV